MFNQKEWDKIVAGEGSCQPAGSCQ
jgi:hypothetical protein